MNDIAVVGGCYYEFCRDPHWAQLYGSGVRAAAALSAACDHVHLYTCVGQQAATTLRQVAKTFRISVDYEKAKDTHTFVYEHPLSEPGFFPAANDSPTSSSQPTTAERVVRFGMLELDPTVCAEWAVYDPQSGFNPRPFSENGSTAHHLAVVVNQAEARFLTRENDPYKAGPRLLESEGAEVVIIKRNWRGAIGFRRGHNWSVPAYRVPHVWPIGSGDVFTATFAYFWAVAGTNPEEASRLASLAAAVYCDSASLPVDLGSLPELEEANVGDTSIPRVYLAGPFFNMAQRWFVEEARKALRSLGVIVFSPFHDVGLGPARVVASADLAGLDTCSALLALGDGFDPGTVAEIGYARGKGLPVVVLLEPSDGEGRTMLDGLGCTIVSDFATSIYIVAWEGSKT